MLQPAVPRALLLQAEGPSPDGRQAELEAANVKLQSQLQRATQQLEESQQLAQDALQARDNALQVGSISKPGYLGCDLGGGSCRLS